MVNKPLIRLYFLGGVTLGGGGGRLTSHNITNGAEIEATKTYQSMPGFF